MTLCMSFPFCNAQGYNRENAYIAAQGNTMVGISYLV